MYQRSVTGPRVKYLEIITVNIPPRLIKIFMYIFPLLVRGIPSHRWIMILHAIETARCTFSFDFFAGRAAQFTSDNEKLLLRFPKGIEDIILALPRLAQRSRPKVEKKASVLLQRI
ncbi:hypothetical protein PUN28_013711 [Cardiocondyla obscurior]|uniref:Uncharacterized protein n=1 Tax=Cardiocondyla obscurior TaxID=286306 RepID=A0AAW2F2M5_9HYME